MIEVTHKQVIYKVYTNTTEVKGMTIVSMKDCQVGDLVRFNNGHYAECLERKEVTLKNGMVKHLIIFPGYRVYLTKQQLERGTNYKLRTEKNMNIRDFAFIELISNGMDILDAAHRAYLKPTLTTIVAKIANAEIMGLIIKRTNMKSLTDAIKKEEITNEVIAKEIADLVKDKKSNPTLRKWALELSMKMLEQDNGKSDAPGNMLAQASSELTSQISSKLSSPLHN